jgi:hypothetical protein
MTTYESIKRLIFGHWVEAYITTTDNEFDRLTGLLINHNIKYKFKKRTGAKGDVNDTGCAYYINVLKKDMPVVSKLFY